MPNKSPTPKPTTPKPPTPKPTPLKATTHETIRVAAEVTWADAMRSVLRNTAGSHAPSPTHVTVVAFPGGATVPTRTTSGFAASSGHEERHVIAGTILRIGLPFFTVIGGGSRAASKVIFLPYKNHGLLIYPTSDTGCQCGYVDEHTGTQTGKTILQSASTRLELKNPAGMLTLLNIPLENERSYAEVLLDILLSSWEVWIEASGCACTEEDIKAATADVLNNAACEPHGRADKAMRAMYEYAATTDDPSVTLECTAFNGNTTSVFGAIIFAVCKMRSRQGSDVRLPTFVAEAFDACFQSGTFGHQHPMRFMASCVWSEPTNPDCLTKQLPVENAAGGEVPAINTSNLTMPYARYTESARTVGLTVSDVHYVHGQSRGIGKYKKAMCDRAGSITYGSLAMEIGNTPRREFLNGIRDYIAVSFGYATVCNNDIHPASNIASVVFHAIREVTDAGSKGKPNIYVTALRACMPGRLSRLREPARALSNIAFKASEALKAAKMKLAIILPAGNPQYSPSAPPIHMNISGPFIGTGALEAIILIKAFQFAGGCARFTVMCGPVALYGKTKDVVYDVGSTHIIHIAPANPCLIRILADTRLADFTSSYVLMHNDSIVDSIRLLV